MLSGRLHICSHRSHLWSFCALIAWIVFASNDAFAASIISYSIGEVWEPTRGDDVTVEVLVGPGEHNVSIEVHPLVFDTRQRKYTLIPSTTERGRSLVVKVSIDQTKRDQRTGEADERPRIFRVIANIPYSQMGFRQLGKYSVTYNINVIANGASSFVQSTPAGNIVVINSGS